MSETKGTWIELEASDGARISAYRVRPSGRPRGGLLVVQEIFGVNSHIRSVAESYAARGYDVIAPALFDRVEKGVELGYDQEGMTKGRGLVMQLGFDKPMLDLAAAAQLLADEGMKVGLVGYCWGGSVAFLAASRVDGLSATVGYYGSTIIRFVRAQPRVPVLLHFGEQDKSIPADDVATIRKERPEVEVQVYPAGHGFNCVQRASYDAASAELALARTLAFFERHLS